MGAFKDHRPRQKGSPPRRHLNQSQHRTSASAPRNPRQCASRLRPSTCDRPPETCRRETLRNKSINPNETKGATGANRRGLATCCKSIGQQIRNPAPTLLLGCLQSVLSESKVVATKKAPHYTVPITLCQDFPGEALVTLARCMECPVPCHDCKVDCLPTSELCSA